MAASSVAGNAGSVAGDDAWVMSGEEVSVVVPGPLDSAEHGYQALLYTFIHEDIYIYSLNKL